jgi:hypothetical protein
VGAPWTRVERKVPFAAKAAITAIVIQTQRTRARINTIICSLVVDPPLCCLDAF